jgi:hypothetical protein
MLCFSTNYQGITRKSLTFPIFRRKPPIQFKDRAVIPSGANSLW